MKDNARVATWLELAVAPEWRRQSAQIRVHPLGTGPEQCFALSMDGRCLCASNGQLTTFHGRSAVERFLELVRIDSFEFGPAEADLSDFPRGHFCLSLDRTKGLRPCEMRAEQCTPEGVRECLAAGAKWLPPRAEWRQHTCTTGSQLAN